MYILGSVEPEAGTTGEPDRRRGVKSHLGTS